jgi:hypothetical protein
MRSFEYRSFLQDWHPDKPTGSTRQELIEINVAQWWLGKDYRVPVRMVVPLQRKAKGFHITGGSPAAALLRQLWQSPRQIERS